MYVIHILLMQLLKSNSMYRDAMYMDNIEGEYAAPLDKMSFNWFDADSDPGATDVKLPGGLTQVINYLAQGINIHLNVNITSISYNRCVFRHYHDAGH